MCYRGPFSHDDTQPTDTPHPHLKYAVGEEKALAAEAESKAKEASRNIGQFKIRVK
jgi:hypothetical protein